MSNCRTQILPDLNCFLLPEFQQREGPEMQMYKISTEPVETVQKRSFVFSD